MGKTDGQHDAVLRPGLFPAHRQGRGAEQMSAVKADLAFLYPDGGFGEFRVQTKEQRLVQRQLQRLSVEEKQNVGHIMHRSFHVIHLLSI